MSWAPPWLNAHAGDDSLLEFLVFGRNRRANNQWKQKQWKETNLAKHEASPFVIDARA